MSIFAAVLFVVCTGLVFSKRFCDGIIAKHFLVFSAIAAVILCLEPNNGLALSVAVGLFLAGIAYWAWKNHARIKQHWHGKPALW